MFLSDFFLTQIEGSHIKVLINYHLIISIINISIDRTAKRTLVCLMCQRKGTDVAVVFRFRQFLSVAAKI